jgi:hypothetical protein
MSDSWITLVHADPYHVPSPEEQTALLAKAQEILPGADAYDVQVTEAVTIHHPMANFKGAFCPQCKADVTEWWVQALSDAMIAGSDTAVGLEILQTPCCGAATRFDLMLYPEETAFGRYAIEIMMSPEAGVHLTDGRLSEAQMIALEDAVQGPLKVVYQKI